MLALIRHQKRPLKVFEFGQGHVVARNLQHQQLPRLKHNSGRPNKDLEADNITGLDRLHLRSIVRKRLPIQG